MTYVNTYLHSWKRTSQTSNGIVLGVRLHKMSRATANHRLCCVRYPKILLVPNLPTGKWTSCKSQTKSYGLRNEPYCRPPIISSIYRPPRALACSRRSDSRAREKNSRRKKKRGETREGKGEKRVFSLWQLLGVVSRQPQISTSRPIVVASSQLGFSMFHLQQSSFSRARRRRSWPREQAVYIPWMERGKGCSVWVRLRGSVNGC